MVKKGNPKKIMGIEDLAKKGQGSPTARKEQAQGFSWTPCLKGNDSNIRRLRI